MVLHSEWRDRGVSARREQLLMCFKTKLPGESHDDVNDDDDDDDGFKRQHSIDNIKSGRKALGAAARARLMPALFFGSAFVLLRSRWQGQELNPRVPVCPSST
ncbi:hypothetical protein PLESTB_001251600 [Pleodorina starrii]|uniref:Uncharacterized protein n=1 Tax=Pleodorina starrii TaxID=330485 RepID=A0A9W6BUD6_9CHLO|nr:hypothetical protein PLESTM_000208300 [Pleodorina starrii]GLC57666.1 hypothetical protein PLESTB_001251600 [Pleodorina starrii]GLC63335.1 hypothetical protein PLESTF_000025400 [Pleodorina starrii]